MDRLISEQAVIDAVSEWLYDKTRKESIETVIKAISSAEPKTDKYEHHIDHTDCLWYGCEGGCPVTCSQYRDGWNDAMDYIFKNGKGYQPYRHDG